MTTLAVPRVPVGVDATAPNLLRLPAVGFVIAYVVLLLLIPSRLIFEPLGAAGTPATMAGIGALIWWSVVTLAGRNPARGFNPIRLGLAVLAMAVLAGYANGTAAGWYAPPSLRQSTDDLYDLVLPNTQQLATVMISAADRGLIACAGWIGITLLITDGMRSWKDLELLVDWVVWLAAIVAGIGVLQFFTGLNIAGWFVIPGLHANSDFGAVLTRSVLHRVSSTAIHPIEFGVTMSGILPLALHRTIHRWGARLVVPPAAVIAIAIFMSVSRSGVLVSLVAGAVLLMGWSWSWRMRALTLVPVFLVVLRVAIPGLVGTIVSLFQHLFSDPSVTARTDDYGPVFWLYHDHETFGRGLFTFVPRDYRTLDNQYLTVLVELGIVGLAVVILLLLTGFFTARGAARRTLDPQARNLSLSVSASILGVSVSYATFDAWGFPMVAGLTFLLLGMAGACWRLSVQETRAADDLSSLALEPQP